MGAMTYSKLKNLFSSVAMDSSNFLGNHKTNQRTRANIPYECDRLLTQKFNLHA